MYRWTHECISNIAWDIFSWNLWNPSKVRKLVSWFFDFSLLVVCFSISCTYSKWALGHIWVHVLVCCAIDVYKHYEISGSQKCGDSPRSSREKHHPESKTSFVAIGAGIPRVCRFHSFSSFIVIGELLEICKNKNL